MGTPGSRMRILVVDDEPANGEYIARVLRGHEIHNFSDPLAALSFCREHAVDIAVVDQRMPRKTGIELVQEMGRIRGDFVALIVSAYTDSEDLIDAVNSNLVFRYIVKPFQPECLLAQVEAAAEHLALLRGKAALERQLRETNDRLADENRALRSRLRDPLEQFVGLDPSVLKLKRQVKVYALLNEPILIQGETGTGKELLAHALHELSERSRRPFLAINCSAIPTQLLESELFGHDKGAFTGAISARPGFFTAADGGTVFLDEIGDLPLEMQPKILRVLQFGTFFPVGSRDEHRTDVRVLSATNHDLRQRTRTGRFREDLLYRINALCLDVPPLRVRRGDILPLVATIGERKGFALPPLSREARDELEAYDYPGNVRELENVVVKLHAAHRALGVKRIDRAHVWEALGRDRPLGPRMRDGTEDRQPPCPGPNGSGLRGRLDETERSILEECYLKTGKSISETARHLGLTRQGVRSKLRRHGLYGGDPPAAQ